MNNSSSRKFNANGWLMLLLGWGLAFFLVTAFYNDLIVRQEKPNQLSVLSDSAGSADGVLILEKNINGHYLVEGFINKEKVNFLLDTGATQVAVPPALAKRAKLPPLKTRKIQTAAGIAEARTTIIENLQLGPSLLFSNINGIIIPDMQDDVVLLGMNALGQLKISQSEGQLTIRPEGDFILIKK